MASSHNFSLNGKSLADLKVGETAVIDHFDDEELSLKLLEMGCLPGCQVRLSHTAPLGCPLCITVDGAQLSLRKEEARSVKLQ